MTDILIFILLAIVIVAFSILAVTSKHVIRSAVYLLFVLLGTAGLYLMLNYHFLFAVQIAVYAGGIMVLFIMAIFLTHQPGENVRKKTNWKIVSSSLLSITGIALCGYIIIKNINRIATFARGEEIDMQNIGMAMMGTEKYQYLLPFEVISVLLLACIVGAIMIARKDKEEEKHDHIKTRIEELKDKSENNKENKI